MTRGNSLVAMLVVVLIIAILAIVFMRGENTLMSPGTGSKRADGKGTTVPGAVMAAARDDVCRLNLKQARAAVMMLHDQDPDERWPSTLEETRIGSQFYKCDLGKEPYDYNPETGEVKCVHLGHEKY